MAKITIELIEGKDFPKGSYIPAGKKREFKRVLESMVRRNLSLSKSSKVIIKEKRLRKKR